MKLETVEFVAQDDDRAVVALRRAVGKAVNLAGERRVDRRADRHEHVDTDVDGALGVAPEQLGILVDRAILEVPTDAGNRAGRGDAREHRRVELGGAEPFAECTRRRQFHINRIRRGQRRIEQRRKDRPVASDVACEVHGGIFMVGARLCLARPGTGFHMPVAPITKSDAPAGI